MKFEYQPMKEHVFVTCLIPLTKWTQLLTFTQHFLIVLYPTFVVYKILNEMFSLTDLKYAQQNLVNVLATNFTFIILNPHLHHAITSNNHVKL